MKLPRLVSSIAFLFGILGTPSDALEVLRRGGKKTSGRQAPLAPAAAPAIYGQVHLAYAPSGAPGAAPAPAAALFGVPEFDAHDCKAAVPLLPGALECSLVGPDMVTSTAALPKGFGAKPPEGCECRVEGTICPPATLPTLVAFGFTGVSPSQIFSLPQMEGKSVTLCMYWRWLPQPPSNDDIQLNESLVYTLSNNLVVGAELRAAGVSPYGFPGAPGMAPSPGMYNMIGAPSPAGAPALGMVFGLAPGAAPGPAPGPAGAFNLAAFTMESLPWLPPLPAVPNQMMNGQMGGQTMMGGMPGQMPGMGGMPGQMPGMGGMMGGMPGQMPGMGGMPGQMPGMGGMMGGMAGMAGGMGGMAGGMGGMGGMAGGIPGVMAAPMMPGQMPGQMGMMPGQMPITPVAPMVR